MRYALAYLVCFQITVNHVHIAHCQQLIDCGINLYIQKEQLILLDEEGHPSLFAPIMIATLLLLAVLGGSIGAWMGMKVWHHKTMHKKFKYGIPAILLIQIALMAYLHMKIITI